MRSLFTALLSGFSGLLVGGIVGFVAGAVIVAAMGTAFIAGGAATGAIEATTHIANNSDAEAIERPNGDIILYVPNFSESAGYQPVLIYDNSSSEEQNLNMNQSQNRSGTSTT